MEKDQGEGSAAQHDGNGVRESRSHDGAVLSHPPTPQPTATLTLCWVNSDISFCLDHVCTSWLLWTMSLTKSPIKDAAHALFHLRHAGNISHLSLVIVRLQTFLCVSPSITQPPPPPNPTLYSLWKDELAFSGSFFFIWSRIALWRIW